MKVKLRVVGGLFLFLFLAIILILPPTRFLIFMPLMYLTAWHDHGPSFLAKLTVDLEVSGQAVRLERVLECRTFETGAAGEISSMSLFKRIPTEYAPTVGTVGTRLPDGSAVMMWTPYFCGSGIQQDIPGRYHAYSDKFVPLMAWTPDADKAEPLEVYFSRAYFEQPTPRVRFKGIKVEPPPKGAKADPPGEFEWFTQKIFREERESRQEGPGRGSPWGFGSYSIPESEWRGHYPELDSLLDGMTEADVVPNVLLPQANLWSGTAAMVVMDRVLGVGGRTMPEQFRGDHTTRTTADLADRWPLDVRSRLGEFRPTDLRDGRLELTDDHGRGYAILRRYRDVPMVTFHDVRLDLRKRRYLFDPETRALSCVESHSVIRNPLKPAR